MIATSFDDNGTIRPIYGIAHRAFVDCNKMETVDIPVTVEYFGDSIFKDCSALKTITIRSVFEYLYFKGTFDDFNLAGVTIRVVNDAVKSAITANYPDATVVVDATLIIRLELSFDVNGGNALTVEDGVTVTSGLPYIELAYAADPSTLPKPTRDYNAFDGWYYAASGDNLIIGWNDELTKWDYINGAIYADVTLYAHWLRIG